MRQNMLKFGWVVAILFGVNAFKLSSQQNDPGSDALQVAREAVPSMVRYSGTVAGHPSEHIYLQFEIYNAAQGGSLLWSERQPVAIGGDGKYSVLLGAGSSIGLPESVFASGEARWLAVGAGDGDESPRVMLVSVPYAFKAGDAESLAGRSPAEFVTRDELGTILHGQLSQTAAQAFDSQAAQAQPMAPVTVSGSGAKGYLPLWTGVNTESSSALFQSGTGSAAFIGVGTATPAAKLDVNGVLATRGAVEIISAAATPSAAKNSPLLELQGSSFNSMKKSAVAQKFGWGTVAARNNTASPSSNLDLFYGTASLSPTGLSISPKGIVTFATGQTFPGIPLLGGNNVFSGSETVYGNFSSSGAVTAGTINAEGTYELGGQLFAFGSSGASNAFLGFSGNSASTGGGNTGSGKSALSSNTLGADNTGEGSEALFLNTTGSFNTGVGNLSLYFNFTGDGNTALGVSALESNETGSYNTAVGYQAGPDINSHNLTNSTAIGQNATVSQSNSLILGQTTVGQPGVNYVKVGVGTATPVSELELSESLKGGLGPVLTLTNPAGGGASASIDFKTYLHSSTLNSPTGRILAQDDNNYGTNITFYSKVPGADTNGLAATMEINSDGDLQDYGTISADAKNFKIDHPSDPANKYLVHASVESSEMMNIYTGNVVTDELGLATVKLPGWFEAENTDFRYQLTVIGVRFAQAIVSKEIKNEEFTISTNATRVKVSWQVTAVRKDAYALAHPLVPEQEKPENERGYYRHPLLYGQPMEKQMGNARQHQLNALPETEARTVPNASSRTVTEK